MTRLRRSQTEGQKSDVDPGLLATVAATLRRDGMLRERDSVLVAVSGGPDSMALLHALVALGRGRWRIGVGHANHRLRGRDSERDARFVARAAAELGLELFVVEAPLGGGANVEERARERRYAELLAVAARRGFRRLATGHTRDDQAETVLHRLLRGSGGAGLRGIARVRGDGVIRPLLDVGREDVLRFLAERGIAFRVDRSNASARFTRNRIRTRVLPVLERELHPKARAALARTADLLRDDEAVLETLAERRRARLEEDCALACRRLAREPAALQRRIVRHWLRDRRGDLAGVMLEHVEAVRALAASTAGGGRQSLPGGTVTSERGWLRWRPPQDAPAPPSARDLGPVPLDGAVHWPGWRFAIRESDRAVRPTPWRAIFDRDAVDPAALRVRTRTSGDRIEPLGLDGTRKLQDVFVDSKVPRDERECWPVVAEGAVVLWVPGLARSRHAPVSARTRRVLVVSASRENRGRARISLRCRNKTVVLPSSSRSP